MFRKARPRPPRLPPQPEHDRSALRTLFKTMTLQRIFLGVGLAVLVGGCASRPVDEPIGYTYHELRHEGSVYVVGSLLSADKVRAGKPPRTTVGRFSASGLPVLFESDGAGLEQWLQAEYQRRHGLSN